MLYVWSSCDTYIYLLYICQPVSTEKQNSSFMPFSPIHISLVHNLILHTDVPSSFTAIYDIRVR